MLKTHLKTTEAQTEAATMIRVRGLSKQYAKTDSPALCEISFEVERGAFVTVLGRSGSGKTTLFRCLNRLIIPDAGEILIDGHSLTRLKGPALRDLRQGVATIFQQFNLIKRLTVLENVLAARLPYIPLWRIMLREFSRPDREWAYYCLERIGMSEYAGRRADTLSGGQQQRVAIARALAQQPIVILADEPIASLDPESATIVLEELKAISKTEGITVLCSLHQEAFALRYGARIIGLNRGHIAVDVPCEHFTAEQRDLIYSVSASNAPSNLS
ncbi:MAG: phosphonate ABC transporter ATP-binding protein [Chloroflexota bacterium]